MASSGKIIKSQNAQGGPYVLYMGMPFPMAHVSQMSEDYMPHTHLGCLFRMQIHGIYLWFISSEPLRWGPEVFDLTKGLLCT